jgi:predicted HNH restriction endonuclease
LPKGEVIKFSIEDFAVLCSNCHKMVHKKNPPYTTEEMKKIIKGSLN